MANPAPPIHLDATPQLNCWQRMSFESKYVATLAIITGLVAAILLASAILFGPTIPSWAPGLMLIGCVLSMTVCAASLKTIIAGD